MSHHFLGDFIHAMDGQPLPYHLEEDELRSLNELFPEEYLSVLHDVLRFIASARIAGVEANLDSIHMDWEIRVAGSANVLEELSAYAQEIGWNVAWHSSRCLPDQVFYARPFHTS